MQRKHHRLLRVDLVEHLDQTRRVERHPVLVQAQVGVDVDDVGASRPQARDLVHDRDERPLEQRLSFGHITRRAAVDSIAAASVSRTSSEPIRSSTGWKKPRTISCSASLRESPRPVR